MLSLPIIKTGSFRFFLPIILIILTQYTYLKHFANKELKHNINSKHIKKIIYSVIRIIIVRHISDSPCFRRIFNLSLGPGTYYRASLQTIYNHKNYVPYVPHSQPSTKKWDISGHFFSLYVCLSISKNKRNFGTFFSSYGTFFRHLG